MKSQLDPTDKLILALDGMSRDDALSTCYKISNLRWVKVGFELFLSSGPSIISDLREIGLHVFLDLKFHDIPATMSAACGQAAKFGAEFITVHACSGHKALVDSKAAASQGAVAAGLPEPTLLAVTILTSWQDKQFAQDLAINQSLDKRVQILADLAYKADIGGCVCSPQEVNTLRSIYAEPFELITPGIRLSNSKKYDQSRVATPSNALRNGASKLVIGRPITKSDDPQKTFLQICNELIKDFNLID